MQVGREEGFLEHILRIMGICEHEAGASVEQEMIFLIESVKGFPIEKFSFRFLPEVFYLCHHQAVSFVLPSCAVRLFRCQSLLLCCAFLLPLLIRSPGEAFGSFFGGREHFFYSL